MAELMRMIRSIMIVIVCYNGGSVVDQKRTEAKWCNKHAMAVGFSV